MQAGDADKRRIVLGSDTNLQDSRTYARRWIGDRFGRRDRVRTRAALVWAIARWAVRRIRRSRPRTSVIWRRVRRDRVVASNLLTSCTGGTLVRLGILRSSVCGGRKSKRHEAESEHG